MERARYGQELRAVLLACLERVWLRAVELVLMQRTHSPRGSCTPESEMATKVLEQIPKGVMCQVQMMVSNEESKYCSVCVCVSLRGLSICGLSLCRLPIAAHEAVISRVQCDSR